MITLKQETSEMIRKEMESIPDKYQKPFNSTHEGYAVLLEEVRELENEVFFGEKPLREQAENSTAYRNGQVTKEQMRDEVKRAHKGRIREEAIQIAAMAARIIQELT